ncbi:MAG: hypothetical protein JWO04_5539 [Gammaproteobacteria bacterium]|jgi:hypothetical protein|nr:hypothetical protein [Gammaproteobacteria bacterium]
MPTIFQNHATSASVSASIPLPGRGVVAFDAVNAHSQAGEPPLCFVMEFNAAESEWREEQSRLLEKIENRPRTASPTGGR